MLRNYLTTALRNLVRNRLYAAINIVGLAVGFAAALLIALYVRDEFSYDKWIPGYERIYLVREIIAVQGTKPLDQDRTPAEIADWVRQGVPEVEVTRLADGQASLRVGEIEADETIGWADPNFFDLLQFPVIAGDLKAALARPDGVVLTRKMARKYFGADAPVGMAIEFGRKDRMTVTAVIEDLPSNTSFRDIGVIASGLSASSAMTYADNQPKGLESGTNSTIGLTFLRAGRGASASDLQRDVQAAIDAHVRPGPIMSVAFPILRLDLVHFHASHENLGKGDEEATIGIAAAAVFILLVACINFVNLTTARATRRAIEVGVRKVSGAERRNLIVQFIGESFVFVVLALGLGLVAAAALLPALNGLLMRTIEIGWSDPLVIASIALLAPVVAVLAGAYPAFVLSAFRPAAVLKGSLIRLGGHAILRQALVILQFAVLIGLSLGATIVVRQTEYAANEALRFDKDQVLVVETDCQTPFKDAVKTLPGVRGAACSNSVPTRPTGNQNYVRMPDGRNVLVSYASTDYGYFELYGLAPVSGRFFSREFVSDALSLGEERQSPGRPFAFVEASDEAIVINETAVREFGFESPRAAIGQTLNGCSHVVRWQPLKVTGGHPCHIIGVVPDFVEATIRERIPAAAYFVLPTFARFVSIKLSGERVPETLAAIDRLWKETGEPKPIARFFVENRVQDTYLEIARQSQLFRIAAGVAIFIAGLGLFGLSAFAAEQRTKEIGIRKAMGATRRDILRLLLWQFTKPVLWANVIAWPVAYVVMRRWLEGFAYHIDLAPWMFLAASALAVVIAMLTVIGHALLVARAKPVTALRYE